MTRFIRNPFFEREMSLDPRYLASLAAEAAKARAAAQAMAPRGATGDFASSLEVARDEIEIVVRSSDPFAHLVEWGSRNNPAYAPLRRGVRAAGLRLEERSK